MPWLATQGASVLQAPLFVVAFLGLSAALGRTIQRWLRVPVSGHERERAILAVAIGAGTLQIVPLTLGAAGLLGVKQVWLALFGIAICLVAELGRMTTEAWAAIRRFRRPSRWELGWAMALIPGLFAAALLALAPTIDPDGLGYHLTVPKRWLASGALDYLPTYPNSNMPMGVEMLFAMALSVAGDSAAKFLHFALGCCGAIALFQAGTRLAGRVVGAAAVSLYLFGPLGVAGLLGWAYLEGATSLAITAAVGAWIIWYQEREPGWLRSAFLLAGIAVSFKITAGLLPLALGGLTLVARLDPRERDTYRARTIDVLPLLGLCLAPVTPWLIRSALVTGNPFFPVFAAQIPSRDFSPELARQWGYFNRYLNWAIVIGRDWSLERRQHILLGCALLLLVIASVTWWVLRSWIARAATLVLLATLLAQLATVGLYVRYWVPMASVLLLPVLAPAATFLAGRWQRGALVVVTVLMSFAQARRSFRSADNDFGGLVRTTLGIEPRATFLERHVAPFPLYEKINRELPEKSKVLLTFYCGGFYIDRPTYCTDVVQGSLRLTTWDSFLSDIGTLGVTHVLAPLFEETGGPAPPASAAGVGFMVVKEERALVSRLLADRGHLLASAGNEGLYLIGAE